ncbi:hypothetical protein BDB01DRAFT_904073 [Pilobolus umbonatus]|nr:hypothetical protein BDB01DRAFT_904073 [Pilobolus umbonatus]
MDLLLAIARNDIDRVRCMSQAGMDVNATFSWNSKDTYSPVIPKNIVTKPELLNNLQVDEIYQCTPLNLAVIGGYSNMVRLLLSAGADINSKDGRGRTALVCAIYGLDLNASDINTSNLHLISQTNTFHFDVMKNILLCHPNLSCATLDSPQNEIKGITPLCLASYLGKADIIQLLLDDGRVHVDGTDSKNATALMYAARDGNVPIVKILLNYHASSDLTDSHGWSAIQYAERNAEIVQLCEDALRKSRSEMPTLPHKNELHVKYPLNHLRLSNLIQDLPTYPSSLSHLPFENMRDIDYCDSSAASIISTVQSAFLQAIKNHDHAALQVLLMKSPLTSKKNGEKRIGPLLVNYHDPKTGLTAIHHAMRTKPLPSFDTIAILYQAGIDINAQTYYGRTALHHLSRFGVDKDGKSWGIQKNGNNKSSSASFIKIDDKDVPQHLARCALLLIQFGALVNIPDPTGNTPLHFAAEFGGVIEVLEILVLEGGADLSAKNKKGQTPLDLCKSDEIRKRLVLLDQEKKQDQHVKSVRSSYSGTIRPFDSASEYNYRSSFPRRSNPLSTSRLFQDTKSLSKKNSWADGDNRICADFEIVLRAFFNYQTIFTDSIESSLSYITDSMLETWNIPEKKQAATMKHVEITILQLRYELCEAHEMFNIADQKLEQVMYSFQDALEQIEHTHQTDWELSELKNNKMEKLYDVLEKIDSRFGQLELTRDDILDHMEKLKKLASRKQQLFDKYDDDNEEDIESCIFHLLQTFLILLTVPTDLSIYSPHAHFSLYQEIKPVVDKLTTAVKDNHHDSAQLGDAYKQMMKYWGDISAKFSKDKVSVTISPPKINQPIHQFKQWKKQLKLSNFFQSRQKGPSLNQLELAFDICHSNLYEIKKDMDDVMEQTEQVMRSKRQMYDLCIKLEKELSQNTNTRPESEIRSELIQVLLYTQQLFERHKKLNLERDQLITERKKTEQRLEETKSYILKIRPPALLKGLLDRLDIDDVHYVKVEKDWKEDPRLVVEMISDKDLDDFKSLYLPLTATHLEQLNKQCSSKMSTMCYMARLNASLYCLKVVVSSLTTKSRQSLLEVRTALGRASMSLDDTRLQMAQLYDNAAEVARQVSALKSELRKIVGQRKEEVINIWKVVHEVSESVGIKTNANNTKNITKNQEENGLYLFNKHTRPASASNKKKRPDDQERHDWIIRELEQLKNIYENLQDQIQDLKRDQALINEELKQLTITLIEPQLEKLIGKDGESLLRVTDKISLLMDHIKADEFGLMISISSKPSMSTRDSIRSSDRFSASKNSLLTSTSAHTSQSGRLSCQKKFLESNTKGLSSIISSTSDRKQPTVTSTTTLSSLLSHQQQRLVKRTSELSSALSKVKRESNKI